MSRADLILDNPIAPGKAKAIAEVLPNGHPSQIMSQGYGYGKPRPPKLDAYWNHKPSPIWCHLLAKTRQPRLPLPGGEGWGEGGFS